MIQTGLHWRNNQAKITWFDVILFPFTEKKAQSSSSKWEKIFGDALTKKSNMAMDAQCCMETKERWGDGIHQPGKQAWKSLSYLHKQLGMIRSRFFCNKIPSRFLTWKTQFIGQLTSIKTTREHETHHLFLLILFPFGWKFWSWEYKMPEFLLCFMPPRRH